MIKKTIRWTVLAIAAAALGACGGGGDSADDAVVPAPDTATPDPAPVPAPSATGVWTGSTDTLRSLTGVVLGDGTYYLVYSPAGTSAGLAGFIQGTGAMSGSMFTSANATDFSLEGAGSASATLSATVDPQQQAFNGTIGYASGPVVFETTPDPASGTAASLALVEGTYSGSVVISAGAEDAEVTVSSTGSLEGTGSSGCIVTGNVTPRTDVPAYTFSLTFGPAPCFFAGQTFEGIAALRPDGMLQAAATDAARSQGIVFHGSRP
ncbi:MAG: hypothetical protein EP306_01445 [Burkholderiales bacterium]|nr:MAG: hypothetical protein EP306_01445 [Burkholderiales bacterium]